MSPHPIVSAGPRAPGSGRRAFLDRAAAAIAPNARPFAALLEHLVRDLGAAERPAEAHEEASVKANVIVNRFPAALGLSDAPPPGPRAPESERRAFAQRRFEAADRARQYPAERLGLRIRAFTLPRPDGGAAVLLAEERTEYLSVSHAPEGLMDELCLYQGVRREDIAARTPRFAAYADALRAAGRL